MEIYLKNIGIIKETTVKIDGLTVITGKNSAGKTTVGKTVYSIVRANSNAQESFDNSKEEYIYSQLEKLRHVLSPTYYGVINGQYFRLRKQREEGDVIALLLSRSYRNADFQNKYQLIIDIDQRLYTLSASDVLTMIGNTEDPGEPIEKRNKTYNEQFEERKQFAAEVCKQTIEALNSSTAYLTYLHQRTKDYLNFDFHKQIKPVRNQKKISQIIITEKGHHTCLNVKIRSKNDFVYDKNSSFVFPFSESIFIDDPFVLDRLDPNEKMNDYRLSDYGETGDNLIHPSDLIHHRMDLLYKLTNRKYVNFFDEMDMQKGYKQLFEKINEIVPGEFLSTQDGFYYIDQGVKLSLFNLATGSKQFFIIKQLLLNGYIGRETLLVLDEPESHLHPEWITKFAEIITLLVEKLNIKIILTTHSPDLLLALKVYSRENGIEEKSHYYLAKRIENDWAVRIDCIDNNINEGYAHLSIPLLEMSVRDRQK